MPVLNTYQVHKLQIFGAEPTVTLDLTGSYVSCLALSIPGGGATPPRLNIAVDHGAPQAIEPGFTFFTPSGEPFTSITLTNPNPSLDLDVELAVGLGDFRDQRLIPELVPNPYSHTTNFRAFFGAAGLPALAANNSHVQLRHPPGTTVVHYIHRVTLRATAAAVIDIRQALSSLVTLTTLANQGRAKRVNSAFVSEIELRTQQNAGLLGNAYDNSIDVPANTLVEVPGLDKDPFLLTSGQSLIFVPQAVNIGLNVTAHWQELPA